MQKDIHPKYFPKAKATCACGKVFELGSTNENIHIEICSACHPFYTGTEKVLDVAGRVEKFKTRRAKAESVVAKLKKAGKIEKTEEVKKVAEMVKTEKTEEVGE